MNVSPTWSFDDLQEARLLQRKLRELFRAERFGSEAMRAVTMLCDRALVTVTDELCQEMFCEVDRRAAKLAARDAHQRRMIGIALDSIQLRLGTLQKRGDAGEAIVHAEASIAKF